MDIIKKIQSMKWERWLHRPQFQAFILSLSQDAGSKEFFNKIGIIGGEMEAALFQKGYWYTNKEVMEDMYRSFMPYLKNHTVFDITKKLELFYKKNKKVIAQLVKEKKSIKEKLTKLHEILTACLTFVWSTHGLEEYYNKKAHDEVPKYIKKDVEEFIGDASFPKKKNIYILMEDDMRKGIDPKIIAKKYGWLRVRDLWSRPFTINEIKNHIKNLKPTEIHKEVMIPKNLKKLFSEIQELVYFRTARTDVLYELMFLARPIFKEAGNIYGLSLKELSNYTIHSLIKGKPEGYSENVSFAVYKNKSIYTEEPIINEADIKQTDAIKGIIAFRGLVKGTARIVRFVSELEKVKKGDILITQMTFPSFISAMNRASAFVTDEGGITCHAAIVAREMKKPCIIGTKIATKVFKDGDLVEVDANKGTVKKYS